MNFIWLDTASRADIYWNQCYFLQAKWKNLSKLQQNTGKFILYSLTFSQEIRATGIVILIAIQSQIDILKEEIEKTNTYYYTEFKVDIKKKLETRNQKPQHPLI